MCNEEWRRKELKGGGEGEAAAGAEAARGGTGDTKGS